MGRVIPGMGNSISKGQADQSMTFEGPERRTQVGVETQLGVLFGSGQEGL